jgi:hypothetical protein
MVLGRNIEHEPDRPTWMKSQECLKPPKAANYCTGGHNTDQKRRQQKFSHGEVSIIDGVTILKEKLRFQLCD